ncbi:MAG: hypothetical protein C4346_14420 [Chloroflexota bacterium]
MTQRTESKDDRQPREQLAGERQPAPTTELSSGIGQPAAPGQERRVWRAAWRLMWEIIHVVGRTQVRPLATQIAYSFMFAIFPTLILVMAAGALANRVLGFPLAARLQELIDQQAPAELRPLLDQLVETAIAEVSVRRASLGAAAALLLAIWGGAGGVGALIHACNRAYGVRDTRHYVVRRVMTLVLTAMLIVGAIALYIFGEQAATKLIDLLNAGALTATAFRWFRWLFAFTLIAASLAVLYYVGPNVEQSVRWVLPGAMAAAGAWLLVLAGFDRALQYVNPAGAYGAAGSVILLLWFLYLTGVVFIYGAIINALLGSRYDQRRLADLARHPERRLFGESGQEC